MASKDHTAHNSSQSPVASHQPRQAGSQPHPIWKAVRRKSESWPLHSRGSNQSQIEPVSYYIVVLFDGTRPHLGAVTLNETNEAHDRDNPDS
eukprot:scaffold181821_cov29-Tisochrysis_lutea.AAC.7